MLKISPLDEVIEEVMLESAGASQAPSQPSQKRGKVE